MKMRSLAFVVGQLAALGATLAISVLAAPVIQGDCKCHSPEKNDKTRWGGNEAIVLSPKKHLREMSGAVEMFAGEKMEGALVEVFDHPDYLISDKPWDQKPDQKLLRNCVTSADGKFCFRDLPSGTYELRVSKDTGWNVTHVYVEIDRQHGKKEEIAVSMHLGT